MSNLATAGVCAGLAIGGAPAAYSLSRLRFPAWPGRAARAGLAAYRGWCRAVREWAAGKLTPLWDALPYPVRRVLGTGWAVFRAAWGLLPKWCAVLIAVLAAIPGAVDELVAAPVTVPVVVWVLWRHRGELAAVAREAWSR